MKERTHYLTSLIFYPSEMEQEETECKRFYSKKKAIQYGEEWKAKDNINDYILEVAENGDDNHYKIIN